MAFRLRLRPVDDTFFDLFTDASKHLVTGADLLTEMLGGLQNGGVDRAELAERMREEEHLADEDTHAIIRKVNTTFVTPFDREDIYALASALDDVMDFMEEAVDLVVLYEIARAARGRRRPGRGAAALRRASAPRRCRACAA